MTSPGDQQQQHAAFVALSAAFREAGAKHLIENLNPGAKPLALKRLEQKLGFSLPKALRTFWLLHDGEKKRAEAYAAPFHLLPVAWVLNALPVVERRLARAEPKKSGATNEELWSNQWVPIAAMEGAAVIVNGKSGRVFECSDETPALRLLDASVTKWFVGQAEREDFDEPIAPADEEE